MNLSIKCGIVLFISGSFLLSRAQTVKKVLLEEFSSTSCGFCPMKTHEAKKWADSSDTRILVLHHARTNDNMTVEVPGLILTRDYEINFQPAFLCNRKPAPGGSTIVLNFVNTLWPVVEQETNLPAKAGVLFSNHAWDSLAREVSGVISVTFTGNMSGSFRVGLFVIENHVTGGRGRPTLQAGVPKTKTTGVKAYDQKCYDNSWAAETYPQLNFEDGIIEEYPHYNVVRAAPFGTYGKEDVIPPDIEPHTAYQTSFSYRVPEFYDSTAVGRPVNLDSMSLVAFVAAYDDDLNQREILNSEMVPLLTDSIPMVSLFPVAGNKAGFVAVFNPQLSALELSITLGTSQDVIYSLHGPLGSMIGDFETRHYFPGVHRELIPLEKRKPGIYFVKLKTALGIQVRKVIVFNE